MKQSKYRSILSVAAMMSATAAMLTAAAMWFGAVSSMGDPPPPANLMGWAGGSVAKQAYERLKGEFVEFKIWGAEGADNSKRRVVLWDAAKLVNNGAHLPTFWQQIGDCVGAGALQAMQHLECVQIALHGAGEEFKPLFQPYHYACGRCAPEAGAGRMGRDPSGSTGSWQAVALKLYGVIPQTPDLPSYSARVVSQWATRMPEAKYIEIGKQHCIKSAALMRTAEDVRDAICNGYPVTIASNVGFLMKPPTVDGKLVNRRSGTWNHQMCVIGYDGTGREPLWYILNSWGPDAHGNPPDDAPPGGFWVRKADIDAIVRQEDSFALSQFDGFPQQDWLIIRFDQATNRVIRTPPIRQRRFDAPLRRVHAGVDPQLN